MLRHSSRMRELNDSMQPLRQGYPANPGAVSAFERCGVSVVRLAEAAEFLFVTADGGGDGVQRDTEVRDLGDESGQGARFLAAGAVFFDDGAQIGVAIESGSPEPAAGGDVIEGDGLSGENYCGAGVFDLLAALFGGHPVCA